MESGNISQLTVPSTPPVQQRIRTLGQERDVDFLSLRLLNKRGRVRLSPAAIDCKGFPGKSSLFSVGNHRGFFAAAIHTDDGSNQILVSTLRDLRTEIESGRPETEPFIPFTLGRMIIDVHGTPTIVRFAFKDERLIVGLLEGPILIYATTNVLSFVQSDQLNPIHTFPGDSSTIPRDILTNPGENPELVAFVRGVHGQEPGHQIDVVDVQQFKHVAGWRKGNDAIVYPVSISWSPKGKQIAIGLQSGDVLLYTPLSPGSPKSHLLKPPSIPPATSSLLAMTWLANPTFHTIFSSPEASSSMFDPAISTSLTKTHVISTHDSKSQSASDIELQDPSPPFGAKFPTGPLSIVLRNWEPTKFIIICGDGPSSDIGVIGSLSHAPEGAEDMWINFILEETSTPSLPLGEDAQDMALLGLEVDLTSSKPVPVSEQPDDGIPNLPPSPILYAYMSDGTVVAWHILNNNGNAYPGMVTIVDSAEGSTPSITSIVQKKPNTQAPRILPKVSPPSLPAGSQFRATGTSGLQAQPAPALAQNPSLPSNVSTLGFGAFGGGGAANSTSKFGSTGFGFGAGPTPKLSENSSVPLAFGSSGIRGTDASTANPQKSFASPSFGTTAFAQPSASLAFGTPGFGSKPMTQSFGQDGFGETLSNTSKPAFGTSGGFAAFAHQGTSAFGVSVNPSPPSGPLTAQASIFDQDASTRATSSAPQSAFGAGGLGQASTAPLSAFGAGGFGSAIGTSSVTVSGQQQVAQPVSAFGNFNHKATFGQTGFGSAPTSTTSSSVGLGGFAALGDALKPSTSPAPTRFSSPAGSPPSPSEHPPDSPETRPISRPTKPSASYVKPADGFGAFMKPSGAFRAPEEASKPASSFIKPAEGFGSLSQQKPATSAFNQQDPVAPAFGSANSGLLAQKSASNNVPTFGSTSALGRGKPVFGTSTFGTLPQPMVSDPSKPISGGFGAFSSTSTGFASFANAGKSGTFGDILGSVEQDGLGSNETSLAFGSAFAPKSSKVAAFNVSTESKVASIPASGKPTNVSASRKDSTTKADLNDEEDSGQLRVSGDALTSQEPSFSYNKDQDSSFSLLSLSETMSQAELSSMPQTSFSAEQEDGRVSDGAEEETSNPEDRDEPASDTFSLTDDGFGEMASDGASQLSRSPTHSASEEGTGEPGTITSSETPYKQTLRSTPSPTPIPSTSEGKLSVVETSFPPLGHSSISATHKTSVSTTPPGSPDSPALPAESSLPEYIAPKPVIPPLAVSPFGLGVGRPSSRPIRSSPLASAPITSADDEDGALFVTSKSTPTTVRAVELQTACEKPSSPAPILSTASLADSGDGSMNTASRRPKTPPLLGLSSPLDVTSAPLRQDFASGQSQASPSPLMPGRSVAPSTVVPNTNRPVQTVQGSREEEEEEPLKLPMQIEFQRAYQEMTKELVQLHNKAQEMAVIRPVIGEPRGLDKFVLNKQVFVTGKYSMGDLESFAKMIGTLEKQVVTLLGQGSANKSFLQDLQNLALISETKLEELSRWSRAREDPDFAKSLKPRALGPEHSENQMQLRKAVQMAYDRIQQCEDQIESLRKRLDQHKSGRVALTPPSLDSIDRTCRNIRLALEERKKIFEHLNARMDALSIQTLERLQSSQGYIRTSSTSPASVTPPFANVAAAALNSERSSLKLKGALLASRKAPLLTTDVTKLETRRSALPNDSPHTQRPEWRLPPVPPLSTLSSSVNRRTARTGKRHGAVQLKGNTPGSDAKPVAFDWGPLPGVAPMEKLPLNIRSRPQG